MTLTALAILLVEFVVYFAAYRSEHGRAAVYRAKYAWVIDSLAIFSGTCVATTSLYLLVHPQLFAVIVPQVVFWIFFVLGSSQAMMHVIKWGIRLFSDT